MLTKRSDDQGYEEDTKNRRLLNNCMMGRHASEYIAEEMTNGKISEVDAQKALAKAQKEFKAGKGKE